MKTISKNARLSVITVVTLMTGVNAFGMDKGLSEEQEARLRLAIIDECAAKHTNNRDAFLNCIDFKNGIDRTNSPRTNETIQEDMINTGHALIAIRCSRASQSLIEATTSSGLQHIERLQKSLLTADEKKQ